jgi:transposase
MAKSVRLRALTRAERRVLQGKVRDRRLTVRLHRRYRLIAEVARGRSFTDVADRVGCNVTMVYEWVHRFNTSGFTTFEQPPNPKGRLPIITGPQIRELIDIALSREGWVGG